MTQLVVAATDGSAINNPNGPAGWAWYVSDTCWGAGGFQKASNQVAELFAVLALLRSVPRDHDLLVRTDSQFTINVATKWMAGWKRKGWVKADGKPVANLALVQELDMALTGRNVQFEWVKSHRGDRANEIADRLCGAASKAIQAKQAVVAGPGWTGAPAVAVAAAKRPATAPAPRSTPATRGATTPSRAGTTITPARRPARGETVASAVVTRKAPVRTDAAAGRGTSGYTRPPLAEPVSARRTLPQPVRRTERDIAPPEARIKQDTSPIGACPSCDFPIHPITLECRCSM